MSFAIDQIKLLLRFISLLTLPMLMACKNIDEPSVRPAHHTVDGFQNPHVGPIVKSPWTFLRMKYFGDEKFADHSAQAHLMPSHPVDLERIETPSESPQITWIGHSTFLIQYQGVSILTDPIMSDRASPVSFAGPQRLVPMPIQLEQLPDIDYVIISHNHYDHLDSETISQLGSSTQFLVPLKLKPWFVELGIEASKVHEFDWWQQASYGALTVTATPSQHWSARGLFDRNKTLWAAWHFNIGDFSLWFAGDTGYNDIQFKEIGERFDGVDVALIPIGAYAPRWFMKDQHVNPEEAVKMHLDVRAKQSFGMHWGTFQLTAEEFFEPKEKLALALTTQKIDMDLFRTLSIGETVEMVVP
jgi:N-acyl-phosphatidylethanolamine-hydrolysing phospholipase D